MPITQFRQYLYNANEPRENLSYESLAYLEAELLESSESMRQRFRHQARRIRNRYA